MLARSVRRYVHLFAGPVLVSLVAVGAVGCDRKPVACAAEPGAVAARPAVDEKPVTPPAPHAAPAQEPVTAAATPRAAQPVAPPQAADPKASRLRIKRLVVAEGVDAREPIGPRSAFRADDMDKVYAFVEVENPERLDGAITVSFEPPEGPEIGNVHLAVGASPRWRTWAFSRAVRQTGEWTAIVRDETGRIIAREPFSVTL